MADYYIPPDLSKDTKRSIDRFVDLSQRTPDDYHKSNMRGVESTEGFLKNDRSFDKSLGMNDYGLSDSISDSANRKYYQNMGTLRSQSKFDAEGQYFSRLEHAAELVGQELKYNEHIKMMKYQAKMARKRARAGVIGSVLGIAGAVVGSVGGPAGAAAGYAIGSGLGNTVAGGGGY